MNLRLDLSRCAHLSIGIVEDVTIEEGEMIGGFGSEIARVCVEENADAPVQIIGLENRFITHGSVPELLRECGLTPEQLADRIEEIAGDKESSHVG